MGIFHTCSGLAGLLLGVSLAAAQPVPTSQADVPSSPQGQADQAGPLDEVENAPTPLNLIELLPDGGIDAVDIEYVLLWEERYKGSDSVTDGYRYVSIGPEDGRLVIQITQLSHDAGAFTTRRHRSVFSDQGRLEALEEATHYSDGSVLARRGTVQEGKLAIVVKSVEDGQETVVEDRAKSVALEDLETRVIFEAMPLVFAYHIRNGSLGYRFQTREFADLVIPEPYAEYTTALEDFGTEDVLFDGRVVRAHALGLNYSVRRELSDEPYRTHGYIHTLENGEVMRWVVHHESFTYSARRATAQEVAERFSLDADRLHKPPHKPERE